jgi:hypothetical protein
MDVFVFQKLEEKTSRINDIWFKGDRGNVLDLESLNPEEIKLALITDVDRLVKMFFDQEKEQLQREFSKVNRAIQMIAEIREDIEEYNRYREEAINAIKNFYNTLVNSSFLKSQSTEAPEHDPVDPKAKLIKKARELKDDIDALLQNSTFEDKDILATGRRIENSYNLLGLYFQNSWAIRYFKEYVSKVRKTERTILKPKGYTIDSDLSKVMAEYELEKQGIQKKAELYNGDTNSERWKTLKEEIHQKKSALMVEGRTPVDRATEFSTLNYLLAYKAGDQEAPKVEVPTNLPEENNRDISELELEALALEVELELLSI